MVPVTAAVERHGPSACKGELLLVVGPSGPGRTALLHALAERLRPAGDAVLLDDPDEGLDEVACTDMWSALRHVAEDGTTVIVGCASARSAGAAPHRTVLLPYQVNGNRPH